jgi:hypothetical protein
MLPAAVVDPEPLLKDLNHDRDGEIGDSGAVDIVVIIGSGFTGSGAGAGIGAET